MKFWNLSDYSTVKCLISDCKYRLLVEEISIKTSFYTVNLSVYSHTIQQVLLSKFGLQTAFLHEWLIIGLSNGE